MANKQKQDRPAPIWPLRPLLILCLALSVVPSSQALSPGELHWVKRAGGTSHDHVSDIAADRSGNSLVTGYFSGTAIFGAGEPNQKALTSAGKLDIFVAKYAPDGALLWAKRAGGSSLDDGLHIATDGSDNILVTGYFDGTAIFGAGEPNQTVLTSADKLNIFVAKYGPSGALLWAKRAGGKDCAVGDIATDDSGNSLVTGKIYGTAIFGAGEPNHTALTGALGNSVFVAKYGPDGTLLWAKQDGGSRGIGVATDGFGNSLVVGNFVFMATFGAGEPNQTTLTSTTGDIFVAKYDSGDTLLWAKQVGESNSAFDAAIAIDNSGNILVTGYFDGTAIFGAGEPNQTTLTSADGDTFVAKYDPGGALLWAERIDGSSLDDVDGIATDGSGNSQVTGNFYETVIFGASEPNQTVLTSSGGRNIFIAQYDPGGALLWAKRAGGSFLDDVVGIATDSSGNSLVTGSFEGTAIFGAGEPNQTALTSAGEYSDIFVAKFEGSLAANIGITPPSIRATAFPDGPVIRILSVGNGGGSDLLGRLYPRRWGRHPDGGYVHSGWPLVFPGPYKDRRLRSFAERGLRYRDCQRRDIPQSNNQGCR